MRGAEEFPPSIYVKSLLGAHMCCHTYNFHYMQLQNEIFAVIFIKLPLTVARKSGNILLAY